MPDQTTTSTVNPDPVTVYEAAMRYPDGTVVTERDDDPASLVRTLCRHGDDGAVITAWTAVGR